MTVLDVLIQLDKLYSTPFLPIREKKKQDLRLHRGFCMAIGRVITTPGLGGDERRTMELSAEVLSVLYKEYQLVYGTITPFIYWFPIGHIKPRRRLIKRAIKRLKQ